MSWTGEARFHCERMDEDPRFYARDEPEMDDWPEPDYFAEAIERARKQAASVTDPEKRRELEACLREAERGL